MRRLAVRAECWFLTKPFFVSRMGRDNAEVGSFEVSEGGVTGRGERKACEDGQIAAPMPPAFATARGTVETVSTIGLGTPEAMLVTDLNTS